MNFSIVIPTYNRRELTAAAVRSALAQRGAGIEVDVVVVDDGSTDGSMSWLQQTFRDDPVRVIPNTRRKGPAGARNTGILVSTGEQVALLDSDDTFLDGHLAECARVFETEPRVDVVFGRARYERMGLPVDYMGPNFDRKLALAPTLPTSLSGDGVRVFSPDFFSHLLEHGCYFNLSTVVLRAAAARELMREELRIAEDHEFWVRLARRHGFAALDRPQIRYTLHDDNISFEAQGSTDDNAPMLLAAYEMMRAYPDLTPGQRALIDQHCAQLLFDWGWRCRRHSRVLEATRLHLRSARFGLRASNLVALLKLFVGALLPRHRNRAL